MNVGLIYVIELFDFYKMIAQIALDKNCCENINYFLYTALIYFSYDLICVKWKLCEEYAPGIFCLL